MSTMDRVDIVDIVGSGAMRSCSSAGRVAANATTVAAHPPMAATTAPVDSTRHALM